jgi:disulfide oxidoreductase YuzD
MPERKTLMAKLNSPKIKWLPAVEEHDYPAAASYLAIIYPEKRVKELVKRLRAASLTEFKAKDIFRASGLSLLGISNSHVEKDTKKIRKGKALSPLLLVRDAQSGRVVIADGYHRLCAIYQFDEDAFIQCKIV